jgi:biopolymer transport protein ExbD
MAQLGCVCFAAMLAGCAAGSGWKGPAAGQPTLSVGLGSRLFLNGQEVPAGALDAELAKLIGSPPGIRRLYVRAHPKATYDDIIAVMSQLEELGYPITRIGILGSDAARRYAP